MFAYDPQLLTDTDKVRFEIGDTVDGAGVKPDGSNFAAAEIAATLTNEGTAMRAVAKLCEVLSRMWAGQANITVGPRSESLGTVADSWAKRAAALRSTYGYGDGTATGGAFAIGFERDAGEESAEVENGFYNRFSTNTLYES
jgi:hypothetical protein